MKYALFDPPRAYRWFRSAARRFFGWSAMLTLAVAQAEPTPALGPILHAPPPAPPIEHATGETNAVENTHGPKGSTLYSIGQPTDEEQLYLEFLNRMRANPTAEGQRLAATTDSDVLSAY